MTIAVFIKRVILVRVVLLAAFSQFLWLTACGVEEQTGQAVKIVTVENIPSVFEIGPAAKIRLSEYDNLLPLFTQVGGKTCIKTEGLYIMALFLPKDTADEWEEIINKGEKEPEELLDYGVAYALMKIDGDKLQHRIISLSNDGQELGYYWKDDGKGEQCGICTLLITPDGRFILRVDFSVNKYDKSLPGFKIEYNQGKYLKTVFTVVRALNSNNPLSTKKPATMLPEDFVEYLFGKF